MEHYKTQSTSRNSATLLENIVIEQNSNTRKVLKVTLNNTKEDSGETVGITIIHERKKNNDEWECEKTIDFTKLKGGECAQMPLSSAATRKLFEKLVHLYAIEQEHGIKYGAKQYTIIDTADMVAVPSQRGTYIKQLIDENHGQEVWDELISQQDEFATKLALLKISADRSKALVEFKKNLDANNSNEGFWQKFFEKNEWIFGCGICYQFLHLLESQPNCGGSDYTGKGQQRSDILCNTEASTKFTVLVEIKTPLLHYLDTIRKLAK